MNVCSVLLLVILAYNVDALAPPLTEEQERWQSEVNKKIKPINLLEHRIGFRSHWVDHQGEIHKAKPTHAAILVQASTHTDDIAFNKACQTVAHMIRHTPRDVYIGVTHSDGVGLFTKRETLTIYPENRHLRDTAACANKCTDSCAVSCTFDGRKYQDIAAVTTSRSVILTDNVLCNARDPYQQTLNLVSHEFALLISKYMPVTYRNRLQQIFDHAKQHHIWPTSYATATVDEYWAEATTAFFLTTTIVNTHAGGMNVCHNMKTVCANEMEARHHLKVRDPQLFGLLSEIYTSGHPERPSGLKVCM